MRRPLLALFAALPLVACAAEEKPYPPVVVLRPSRVVLLESRDGHKSTLEVTDAAGRNTVLDKPLAAVRVDDNGDAVKDPAGRGEVKRLFGPALAALPVPPKHFTLLFRFGKDELAPGSEAKIQELIADLRQRKAWEVEVVGHTDLVGGERTNDPLSRRRAAVVKAALLRAGIPDTAIVTTGRGDREPAVRTRRGVREQQNRRAEVIVR